MRRIAYSLSLFAFLSAGASPAGAAVAHVVAPGETLWSIAAANNLTTRTVAVFNGLSEDAHVILGSTIMVPTTVEGYAALQRAGLVPASPAPAPAAPADAPAPATTAPATPAPAAAPAAAPASAAPNPLGAYTVRWGDTLGALAAQARVSVEALATMNGLDPAKPLLAGTLLKLPAGAPIPASAANPAPAPVVPAAAPNATPGRVSADQIHQIAAAHGVPGSLAAALAWQESGFNNAMVSAANARGVMQVMPGTWDWIQSNLASGPLDPNSPTDNVKAGVLYLGRLLQMTGGDQATAVAGYYQGLGSVRSRGLFEDTKQYVANVQALQGRFGG